MTTKQKKSQEFYLELTDKIKECNTEEELDAVNDIRDELHIARLLSKNHNAMLEEELDDRLMTLVEEGKV